MSITSNSIRRHLVAASCAVGAAATAYATHQEEASSFLTSHTNQYQWSSTNASNDASFWTSTLLLVQDPFLRTTLAEPSGLKAKKKLTKAMTLQEKWEYFTLKAINPGEDDDDDDDDEDDDDVSDLYT